MSLSRCWRCCCWYVLFALCFIDIVFPVFVFCFSSMSIHHTPIKKDWFWPQNGIPAYRLFSHVLWSEYHTSCGISSNRSRSFASSLCLSHNLSIFIYTLVQVRLNYRWIMCTVINFISFLHFDRTRALPLFFLICDCFCSASICNRVYHFLNMSVFFFLYIFFFILSIINWEMDKRMYWCFDILSYVALIIVISAFI